VSRLCTFIEVSPEEKIVIPSCFNANEVIGPRFEVIKLVDSERRFTIVIAGDSVRKIGI